MYLRSNARMCTDATPGQGDDMLRQVGIKIWVDGSPWVGNIDLTFPYLDTPPPVPSVYRPVPTECANYTREQLARKSSGPTFRPGLADLSCTATAVWTILGVYEGGTAPQSRRRSAAAARTSGPSGPTTNCNAPPSSVSPAASSSVDPYWGDGDRR